MDNIGPPPGFDPEVLSPPSMRRGPWRLRAIAPDVAGGCNLACRYCAERATQPKRPGMTSEVLKAAWRLLFPDCRTEAGCSIRLGSGEPLLALPLVRELAELVIGSRDAEGASPPRVFVTTNGTLLDQDTRDWLVSLGWNVKISLDGPEHVHDRWRVKPSGTGTFREVADAAIDLARRAPDRLSTTAVLCRGADPDEVFKAIAELGVRRIELVPVAHADPAVRPDASDIKRYAEFAQGYAEQCAEARETGAVPTLVRFETRVRRAMGYTNSRVPCAAGRSYVAVGADGELYPCFRFVGLGEFRLGHVATGIDAHASLAFQQQAGRPYERRQACRECWAAPLCGGPCFACAEMFGPGDGEPIPEHCAYTVADACAAVWLVQQLRERAPERLLRFLPGAPSL